MPKEPRTMGAKIIAATPADFDLVKAEAEKLYKTTGSVHCPYLGKNVGFNRDGLEHIGFKRWNHARPVADQHMRFKLLHLAPRVLSLSHTVQGVQRIKKFVRQKRGKKWEELLKDITYYEFVAVLKNVRVRVVVRRIAGGEPHFWSIIPYWRQNPQRNQRVLHTGDLEQD
jgi:hypothetical protein